MSIPGISMLRRKDEIIIAILTRQAEMMGLRLGGGTLEILNDGFAMAKKGLAGKALGGATVASFLGGMISLSFLVLLSPQVARFDRLVGPGKIVIETDSHSTTLGALGAFASGVGATDLAIILLT
ncbi:tripartite tricarboxylate transporter permease, partial [Acetomicrobium sp. S15 = DSM 107314]|uniref:tripartite tricarboxylate transporter permease n=1 Tax=Acetomicrobium sp. S15 = DSM 107314 TaxID=2529858 RepID=UPI0022B7C8D0